MASKKTKCIDCALSDCLGEILSLKVCDDNDLEFLSALGCPKNHTDNKTLIMAKLVDRAKSGDISAIKEIRAILTESDGKDLGALHEIIKAVKNVE